jgi:uncharacterized membrane protein
MSTRSTILTALLIIAAVSITGALLWGRLPDPMASHWSANDQVDGSTSKFWGVFMMPVMSLGMLALFLLIPSIDPLKANIAKFRPTFNVFILLLILFLGYLWALTILWNLGRTDFKMSLALLPALGLLFIFIGLLLRKSSRNWFIGIRTPWTLSSDQVWDETHRIGSVLFIASGILAMAGSLFGRLAFWFVFVPIIGSTIFLTIYSYVLYRRETRIQSSFKG